MKKLMTLISALIIALCLAPALTVNAAGNNPSGLTATLSGMKVLNAIKDRAAVTKGEKYLSLKIKLACQANTPLAFPLNSITLKTPKGKHCELIGIGNGTNDFSEFNVYLPFSAPWYPFSMTYQDNGGKKLFGIKQKDKNDQPEISLLSSDQVLLLGFVVPVKTAAFMLGIGPAKAVRINVSSP